MFPRRPMGVSFKFEKKEVKWMAIQSEAKQDYKKTAWSSGMPITQDSMNNIEDNIFINRKAI